MERSLRLVVTLPQSRNDILISCSLVDQKIWPHELMLKLDTSESYFGKPITD